MCQIEKGYHKNNRELRRNIVSTPPGLEYSRLSCMVMINPFIPWITMTVCVLYIFNDEVPCTLIMITIITSSHVILAE